MSEKLKPCPWCGSTPWIAPEGGHADDCYIVMLLRRQHEPDELNAAWNRRELESASQHGGGEAEDIIERFKNPMTPYGMLIRALRIVAGTTQMDMANHAGITPAHLSAIETGRKPLFHEDVVAASGYFHGLGIPGTLIVLERAYSVSKNAARAAPSAGNGGAEG